MDINEMSKEDFKKIPKAKWDENIGKYHSLVIIPTGEIHDSGYMCMEFVAVNDKNEPIKRMSGCSDVIHLDGIGGYGNWYGTGHLPQSVAPKGWSIDCLPCGYLRIFSKARMGLYSGVALSSYEVYSD